MGRGVPAWAACALFGLVVCGCEGEKRPYTFVAANLPDASAMGASQPNGSARTETGVEADLPLAGAAAGAAAGALGARCNRDSDCGAGNCVDGVCCDSPCAELCAACNLPGSLGVCAAAPNDPLCPQAVCQGQSSECRPLTNSQALVTCEALGVCRAGAECTAQSAAAGTSCQQGTGTCDGQGACLVPGKKALGAACQADGECAEAHCVASGPGAGRVCCDAACDGVCQACSAAGRCEVTPATDARCPPVTCPADNACRDYVTSITDNLCRSFGQCRGDLDCVTPDFFTSLRPIAQCVCEPSSGACSLAVGTPCEQNDQCSSRACVQTADGGRKCCSGGCAAGLFCGSAGTGCVQCEGAEIECNGNEQRTCNAGTVVTTTCPNGCMPGIGCNALPPVGFLCTGGQCAASGVCQQDAGGQARCCVRNCAAEGKVCSPTGSCDCPQGQVATGNGCLLEPGDPCQNTGQCQTGLTCVDGVCCREGCGGYCERCEAGTGNCTAVPAGQQEADPVSGNNCTNAFQCTGQRNSCKARTGEACSSNDGSDCASGSCEATAGGGARVCCSQACDGARGFCRSNGQGCVQCESAAQCGNGCNVTDGTCNALKNNSDTCSVAAQCSSNSCVRAADNSSLSRCCPNCAAGQLCSAQGQCVNPQNELGGTCSTNANCRVGVCSSGICCSSACDPNCETCNGSGVCQSNGLCDAFDCVAPNPPPVAANLPGNNIFLLPGSAPPAARGGTIRDGRYVPTRIDIYADLNAAVFIPTYEFQGRSVQIAEQDFLQFSPPSSFLPERHFAGTFAASASSLTFQTDSCEPQFNQPLGTPTAQYTATTNGLVLTTQQVVGTVAITYVRQ